jgi:3-deoxy-D-arabino-heptulosonate 7-phosphate (DAHP) synthase class II
MRRTADIVSELSASIRIHNRLGSRLGGVHLEMTGEVNEDGYSVTECLGGSMELQDEELSKNYQVRSEGEVHLTLHQLLTREEIRPIAILA